MTEPVVLEAQGLVDDSNVANRRSLGMSFRKVWLSVAISSSGDGMFLTAFPLLALTVTTNPLLIAGVTVASRLPWLFFSMVSGAIADRMDRRSLMVGPTSPGSWWSQCSGSSLSAGGPACRSCTAAHFCSAWPRPCTPTLLRQSCRRSCVAPT